MNKIVALAPDTCESTSDCDKLIPFIGHSKGLFLANFPRNWAQIFLNNAERFESVGFWDAVRLRETLKQLKQDNALIALRSGYQDALSWDDNYEALGDSTKSVCVPIFSRGSAKQKNNINNFDPRILHVGNAVYKNFSETELLEVLQIFLRQTAKVAFVDRHNYLDNEKFTSFIRATLKVVENSKCHEIKIFSRFDPNRPYMRDSSVLLEKLSESLHDCITPTYGVTYFCCDEYIADRPTDLHSRQIVTNHVLFSLGDSIAGRTFSKYISRVDDSNAIEQQKRFWIDDDHGLEIISSATFKNLEVV